MEISLSESVLTDIIDRLILDPSDQPMVLYNRFQVIQHEIISSLHESYTESEIKQVQDSIKQYDFGSMIKYMVKVRNE